MSDPILGGEPYTDASESASPAADVDPAPWGLSAAWRRGMMHAVERVDIALATKGTLSKRLAAVTKALDEVTELQRGHFPASYDEAFRICANDLHRATQAAGQSPSGKSEDGSSPQNPRHSND